MRKEVATRETFDFFWTLIYSFYITKDQLCTLLQLMLRRQGHLLKNKDVF